MTTDRKIIAFVATGEERTPKLGEWVMTANADAVCVIHKEPTGMMPRFIFAPIHSDHPQAAAILAAVPKPLTLGERVVEEIRKVERGAVGHVISNEQIVEIVNRLAAEGNRG